MSGDAIPISLVKKPPTEEILTEERLKEILKSEKPIHYIGFEISGFIHLGTGLVCMSKVKDFQEAGIKTQILLADWHAWLNKKFGGNLDKIKEWEKKYFKKALEISLKIMGGNPEKVRFYLGSELYEKLGLEYWKLVSEISLHTTVARILRSTTILGRKFIKTLSFSQLLYVPMQVADIFALNVNLAHGGIDQRKAHVIAIEVGEKIRKWKPVAIHHHLLMGIHLTDEQRRKLVEAKRTGNRQLFEDTIIETKMSKSKPETCIFIHDSEEEIKRKMKKAICPWGETEANPVWDIIENLIKREVESFQIINEKTGKELTYENFEDLKRAWIKKQIHPLDLKNWVADWLIRKLRPARKFFSKTKIQELVEDFKNV